MSPKNNCNFIGNLVRDVELKHVGENETALAEFTLAVSEYNPSAEDKQDVCFVRMRAWSKGAETLAKLGSKGSQLAVSASLKQDRYEKDGEKKVYDYYRVNSFEFLKTKKVEQEEVVEENEDGETPF